jgi:maltose alpha-D-glucosyltransferase/alpha-amylase
MKIRHRGFHLRQMLIVKDDVSVMDFEGEPRRSIADRRRKAPAAGSAANRFDQALGVAARRARISKAKRASSTGGGRLASCWGP